VSFNSNRSPLRAQLLLWRPLFKLSPYTVYLIYTGGFSLLAAMMFVTSLVYQSRVVGLDALQLVLVGTTLEITVFLGQVPTGIVADVYSRRLSVIVGIFMVGVGFLIEGSIPLFGMILLAQVIWGTGFTFIDGALEAWIVDELEQSAKLKAKQQQVFLRGAQTGQIGELIGIIISPVLASIALNLPLLVGGASFLVMGVLLVLTMSETGFEPAPHAERSTWRTMANTMRLGLRVVRGRRALMTLVGVGFLYGMYSEGLDRLWQKHLIDNVGLPAIGTFDPIVWFSIINIAITLLAMVSTEIVRRRIDTRSPNAIRWGLFGVSAVIVAALAVFALTSSFALALLCIVLIQSMRATISPLKLMWINMYVESGSRATVLSMFGQIDAIGQIAGGPGPGLIGQRFGLRAALGLSTLILSPVLWLYARYKPEMPMVTESSDGTASVDAAAESVALQGASAD
jgi:MFS transporter, DHA3 family, tetracycline resistance protein